MFTLEDHVHDGGVWHSYIDIMTDPGHILAEFTFSLLDLVVLGPVLVLLWAMFSRWLKNKLNKEHKKFDEDHGVCHNKHDGHFDAGHLHEIEELRTRVAHLEKLLIDNAEAN